MGAIFLVDLGNKTATAPTAPTPMAMFRGVRAGMFEVAVVVDVCRPLMPRKMRSIKRDE